MVRNIRKFSKKAALAVFGLALALSVLLGNGATTSNEASYNSHNSVLVADGDGGGVTRPPGG